MMIGIVLITQIVFWLTFTHLKSRFLLPAAVPLTLGVALGIAAIVQHLKSRPANRAMQAIGVSALLLWSILPALIYHSERDGAPAYAVGRAGQLSGDDLTPQQRQEIGESALPAIAVNHLLPLDSKVLLIGHATPLYFRLNRIAYQTTWDRGPLSQLMRQFSDDPARWAQVLREERFTHLLVDEGMLRRWERARWNDPLLTRQRVIDFAERFAQMQHRYPNAVTLYQLRGE
jgi:hypothetical protein